MMDNNTKKHSCLTTDMLEAQKRMPYTKREILQKEYPAFWDGANELVRILRELQNLLVELLPLYKQKLSNTESLDDNNSQTIFLNYIKYRILYAFAETVWKKTEQHCTDIVTKPNDNDSAKAALIHALEVFDSYSLMDIVDNDENGYKTMNEMIEMYEPHLVFHVLSLGRWEYHDIITIIQSCGLKSEQCERLWKDAIADPDPKEASIGEFRDDDEMIRIY
ncbi:MAG: hypothetical protein IKN15_06895 [Bacteroidaceae bacterium]|nr:hypothetical protein [Bacteroidaceae bacterium]